MGKRGLFTGDWMISSFAPWFLWIAWATHVWAEPKDLRAVRASIQNASSSQEAFATAEKEFLELETSSDPIKWDFHALMASAASEQDNFEQVQKLVTEASRVSDLSVFARYYYMIAQARMNQFQGDIASAKQRFEKAYGLAIEINDPACIITPLIALAFLNSQEGNTQEVFKYLERMQLLESKATPATRSVIYAESAGLYFDTGDYTRAVEYGNKAVKLAESVGNLSDLSAMHSNLGLFHAEAGDSAAALRHRLKALQLMPANASPSLRARRRLTVGVSLHSLKRHAEAYEYLKDLPPVFDQAAIPRFQIESRRELAAVLNELGRSGDALRLYRDADTILQKQEKTLRYEQIRLEILEAERLILAGAGQWAQAYEKAQASIAMSQAIAKTEREKGLTEFRIKYDTAVKEKENQQLELAAKLASVALEREKESNQFYRTLILTLTAFVLILGVLIIYIIRILRQLQAAKDLTESQAQEIATILATIDQSIFTLSGEQLRINQQMSRFARDHFQIEAGTTFSDFLSAHFDLPKDELQMITSILSGSIDMLDLGFMTDSDKLPKELRKTGPQGVDTYEVDWVPIMRSSDKHIEQFLVCIRNVTEFRKLQSAIGANQDRLHFLGHLAQCGPLAYRDFQRTWLIMHQDVEQQLKTSSVAIIVRVFRRHVHTLKGLSRMLNFNDLSNLCHSVEEAISAKSPDWDKAFIEQQLATLADGMLRYRQAARDQLGWDEADDRIQIERTALQRLTRRLLAPVSRESVSWQQAQHDLLKLSFPSLKALVEQAAAGLPELARALQKPEPAVHITGDDIFLDAMRARMLASALPHLLRNALDHGIESAERRMKVGKSAAGNIQIAVAHIDANAVMHISDDGQGLNLERIASIAREKGLAHDADRLNAAAWAELIFHPGFSTSQEVTDISGRGIGMDAVRELLREAGGTIELALEDPETKTLKPQALVFRLIFPILDIAWPEAS
jgi:chemotaxis protein histidine kinase CheA